jgi:hypothetical protein
MKSNIEKIMSNLKLEGVKFFKRMLAVGTGMIIIGMFVFGFAMVASAVIQGGIWSILLLIFGVGMVYYSSKAIDITIRELIPTQEKPNKKRKRLK